jgi:SAM-dependent methyltransferase
MSDSPGEITHRVREFYERCHFPGDRPLDHDGLVLTRWFAKSVAARNGAPTRVLDAGCGTGNTSVALARHYPAIQFLGVDHSLASLAQAGERARHSGLSNLSFHHGDLMQPLAAGRFDIILCLGVLHHTADMRRVLANLRNCLNPGGHLYLWVYGKHGRYRHSLNMRLLAMLTGPASPGEALPLAREFALGSGNDSPLDDLLGRDRLDPTHRRIFRDPIWIADQFLHPHETPVDLEELLQLISGCGLELQRQFDIREDLAAYFPSAPLREQFLQLSPRDRLIALDLLLKPERYFVLLGPAPAAEG